MVITLMTTHLPWTCCRRRCRRRCSLYCGSSGGSRCRWWPQGQRSRARYRRTAASTRSHRTGDLDVQCQEAVWAQWSESDRVLSPEQTAPSSLTVPTRCDVPVTVTHIQQFKQCYTHENSIDTLYNSNKIHCLYMYIHIVFIHIWCSLRVSKMQQQRTDNTTGVQKVLQLNMMHKWHKQNFCVIIHHNHP